MAEPEYVDCSPPGDPVLWLPPLVQSMRDVFGVEVLLIVPSDAPATLINDVQITGAFIGNNVLVVLDRGDPEDVYLSVAIAEHCLLHGFDQPRRFAEPVAVQLDNADD